MFRPFADWLSATQLSLALQKAAWVVPTSQSVHIVCVSVVFASSLMINARVFGIGKSGRSVSQLTSSLVPWMWRSLILLLITGSIQTVAEPVRQFVAPVFWAKMAMIVLAASLTAAFARAVRADAARWDAPASRPAAAKAFAVASCVLWVAIIVCGRFIGYTYSFYL